MPHPSLHSPHVRAGARNALAIVLAASLLVLSAACSPGTAPPPDGDGPLAGWREVGGNAAGQRYSPLEQIHAGNVAALELAWSYNTGDVSAGSAEHGPTTFQATPIVIGETLYFCTPFNRVIALDAATGAERWVHDPEVDLRGVYTPACRGVAYWEETQAAGAHCARRIISATLDARLIALDADTGQRCEGFGEAGAVNLKNNLGDVRSGEYYVTSAPLVMGDLVVTGAFVQDGQRVDAPPGVVRAFDARSGALAWAFDPVPPGVTPVSAADAAAGAVFTRGTPNVWGQISADVERGIVYLPTGNPQPDHYGGAERGGRDHYGTSVVALDGASGTPWWHFQTVHHDVWDYDIAAQPVLFEQHGRTPAVVAATKTGQLFLLDRTSGKPLFPVEERAVPQSTVPGEQSAATQPFPSLPLPLHPQTLTEDDIWGLTPIDRAACLEKFREVKYQGIFTPPGFDTTLVYPGLGGGVNWGSVSVDPARNLMIVNSMRVPYTVKLVPREQAGDLSGSDQVGANAQEGTPYVVVRDAFLSPWGTPCVAPPWGLLTAIDLDTGALVWERPLGNLRNLAPLGMGRFFEWGGPNTGGSIQTAGGLTFIGASMDGYFRAFDSRNGEELWRHALPAPAQATPMTYRVTPGGRQFVVIAAGGHGPLAYAAKGPEKMASLLGDTLVAFALPQ
jgi:quinoprotein glucose dehydrogenase